MHALSYIIKGDKLTPDKLLELETYIKHPSSVSAECEIVLYFTSAPVLDAVARISYAYSRANTVSSIEKAITMAKGRRLVFTTYVNLLADRQRHILKQAVSPEEYHFAIPACSKQISQILGISRTSNAGYIIASKPFATANAQAFVKPSNALLVANKLLAISILPPPDNALPQRFIADTVIYRPNLIILRNIFYIRRQQWRDSLTKKRDKRRAEKLRKRVLPILYSNSIPVFIICRDRVEPLKKLVKWCEDEGLKNIYLIDNASSYPPLLEYYKHIAHEIIYLGRNVGHTSPWDTGIVDVYAHDRPYIVSDPDVIPSPKAHGAVKYFVNLFNKYPERRKVGFGLRIDNIPDHYALKDHVISWEKQFWISEVEPNIYDAEIDTTFALYRPRTPYVHGPGLRTGGIYVAEHELWYQDSNNITEEVKYYRSHADKTIGSWGVNTNDVSQTYITHKYKSELS